MTSGGSCGLLGPGRWCWRVRTILLHRRPRSQSAQECGRGSSENNVQRSNATLGPTRFSLVLLSSRKQEDYWAGPDFLFYSKFIDVVFGLQVRVTQHKSVAVTHITKTWVQNFPSLVGVQTVTGKTIAKQKKNKNDAALPPNGTKRKHTI